MCGWAVSATIDQRMRGLQSIWFDFKIHINMQNFQLPHDKKHTKGHLQASLVYSSKENPKSYWPFMITYFNIYVRESQRYQKYKQTSHPKSLQIVSFPQSEPSLSLWWRTRSWIPTAPFCSSSSWEAKAEVPSWSSPSTRRLCSSGRTRVLRLLVGYVGCFFMSSLLGGFSNIFVDVGVLFWFPEGLIKFVELEIHEKHNCGFPLRLHTWRCIHIRGPDIWTGVSPPGQVLYLKDIKRY